MQAQEARLRKLIEGTNQYVVPLFQRPYSWSLKQWKTLWSDIKELAKSKDSRPHFFGSVVTAPARSVPQGVGKYLLIDGQQRITTIQIILSALRDQAKSIGYSKLADKIHEQFLINKFNDGDDVLKVLPTQDDRLAFRSIIFSELHTNSRLSQTYNYFYEQISTSVKDEKKLEKYFDAISDRLSLVSITCDEKDNPHLIFESLNAKGERLTPADLIRNYILMLIKVTDQAALYNKYWRPLQDDLHDLLTEFVRHYLMKDGKILRESDVYIELKERLSPSDDNTSAISPEQFLEDLYNHGRMYANIVNGKYLNDAAIASSLNRIRKLDQTVVYPLLLRVFDAYSRSLLSKDQVLSTLDILESFLLRRIVCAWPTNQLRQMLPPVFDAAGGASIDFVERLQDILGGDRCPDDSSFKVALSSSNLYGGGKKLDRVRIILERIEESFGHKEPASLSNATIEHVLPQSLTPEWEHDLGDAAKEISEKYLHRIGNLTLTAYNSELSNRSYSEKRVELLRSHFELNKWFEKSLFWNADTIEERSADMAECALRIWKDLKRNNSSKQVGRKFEAPPKRVRYKNDFFPVKNWRHATTIIIECIEKERPGVLLDIANAKTIPNIISLDSNRFQRKNYKISGVYVQMHASAKTLRDNLKLIVKYSGNSISDYEYIFD